MKHDNGKPSLSLLPVDPLLEVAEVFGFGAKKYGRNNWREDGNNTEWLRTYDSIQRHMTSWLNGEDLDPESGKSHLSHAMCQMLILRQHMMDGHTPMDNRYNSGKVDNSDDVDPLDDKSAIHTGNYIDPSDTSTSKNKYKTVHKMKDGKRVIYADVGFPPVGPYDPR